MGWITAIGSLLKSLLDAFNLWGKYNPPKTEEQKTEESQQQVDGRLQKEQDGDRPTWGK
jgi:hypothetical protein